MKQKKIKIYVPDGNPDDGFLKRKVKAHIIHHPYDGEFTLMGYKDKKQNNFCIVELTTGRLVADGPDKMEAFVDLAEHYKPLPKYKEIIASWTRLYGRFNEPFSAEYLAEEKAVAEKAKHEMIQETMAHIEKVIGRGLINGKASD